MPKNADFDARFDAGEITWEADGALAVAQPKVARTTNKRLVAQIAAVLNDRNEARTLLRLNGVDVLA
jgi:hypothetical protein